ncbi:MAG: hypothetical protein KBA61_10845 [Spirochaetes bacterium]|nr:hypothetical protein [Spirochaetota bacterium]
MKIATTLSMRKDVCKKLDNAVMLSGRARSELIVALMRRAMRDFGRLVSHCKSVQYQDRAPKDAWRMLHVRIFAREYEYFLDSRKFFKRSVSLLVAYAIDNYLDEVLYGVSDSDNYQFLQYAIIPKRVDTAICWQIYWGIPRKKTRLRL